METQVFKIFLIVSNQQKTKHPGSEQPNCPEQGGSEEKHTRRLQVILYCLCSYV